MQLCWDSQRSGVAWTKFPLPRHAVGGKGLDQVGPDEIGVRIHEVVVACLFKRSATWCKQFLFN